MSVFFFFLKRVVFFFFKLYHKRNWGGKGLKGQVMWKGKMKLIEKLGKMKLINYFTICTSTDSKIISNQFYLI